MKIFLYVAFSLVVFALSLYILKPNSVPTQHNATKQNHTPTKRDGSPTADKSAPSMDSKKNRSVQASSPEGIDDPESERQQTGRPDYSQVQRASIKSSDRLVTGQKQEIESEAQVPPPLADDREGGWGNPSEQLAPWPPMENSRDLAPFEKMKERGWSENDENPSDRQDSWPPPENAKNFSPFSQEKGTGMESFGVGDFSDEDATLDGFKNEGFGSNGPSNEVTGFQTAQ